MQQLLFLNSCLRPRGVSRTLALCDGFLTAYLAAHPGCTVTELDLTDEPLAPLTADDLNLRADLVAAGDLSHPALRYARLLTAADLVVVGAPYWDLSFPARLKLFFERACVTDLTFRYTADGPQGLCRANTLVYLTSAGGFLGDCNFGFDYISGLCKTLLGIGTVRQISAQGLDIEGMDVAALVSAAVAKAAELAAGL